MPNSKECLYCDGTGKHAPSHMFTCEHCGGTGTAPASPGEGEVENWPEYQSELFWTEFWEDVDDSSTARRWEKRIKTLIAQERTKAVEEFASGLKEDLYQNGHSSNAIQRDIDAALERRGK